MSEIKDINGIGIKDETARNAISDVWVPRTWTAGEICISDNKLWKCLVDNSERPSVGGVNWKQISVAEEIDKNRIKTKVIRISLNSSGISTTSITDNIINAYAAGYTIIPIVTPDGSSWTFKALTTDMQPIINTEMTIYYRHI